MPVFTPWSIRLCSFVVFSCELVMLGVVGRGPVVALLEDLLREVEQPASFVRSYSQ